MLNSKEGSDCCSHFKKFIKPVLARISQNCMIFQGSLVQYRFYGEISVNRHNICSISWQVRGPKNVITLN